MWLLISTLCLCLFFVYNVYIVNINELSFRQILKGIRMKPSRPKVYDFRMKIRMKISRPNMYDFEILQVLQ